MGTSTQPGQPANVAIIVGGVGTQIGPDQIDEEDNVLQSGRTLANAVYSVNVPYLPQLADVINGKSWTLRFPRTAQSPAMYRVFSRMIAWAGYFDLCRFKEETEIFTWNGTARKLLRRPFLTFLDEAFWPGPNPTQVMANYATTALINGAPTTITVDATPNPAYGRPGFSLGDTPARGDIVEVRYVPLYMAKIDWGTGSASSRPLAGTEPFKETRQLAIREINGA